MSWMVEQFAVGDLKFDHGFESPPAQVCAVQMPNIKSRRWRRFPLQSQALEAFLSCPLFLPTVYYTEAFNPRRQSLSPLQSCSNTPCFSPLPLSEYCTHLSSCVFLTQALHPSSPKIYGKGHLLGGLRIVTETGHDELAKCGQ